MKQSSQKKKQPSNKSSEKQRTSDHVRYEDQVWQAPKYGLKNAGSTDQCCGDG